MATGLSHPIQLEQQPEGGGLTASVRPRQHVLAANWTAMNRTPREALGSVFFRAKATA